jgi:hypothetical protein
MFVKLVLLITFFWCIFSQLFQRIQNQREILRFFGTFFDFFQNLKPNAQETAQKIKKRI